MQVGDQQSLSRGPEQRAFGQGRKILTAERKGNHFPSMRLTLRNIKRLRSVWESPCFPGKEA